MFAFPSVRRSCLFVVLLAAGYLVVGRTTMAGVVLSSYETTPGNTYQIAFVTTGETTGTSTNIADYNSFVLQQADENAALTSLSPTWKAIVSTTGANAITNAPTYADVPIFNTAGQMIASGSAQLWSTNPIDNPIDYDQMGQEVENPVWTGTYYLGYGFVSPMGNFPLPVLSDGQWEGITPAFGESLSSVYWLNEGDSYGAAYPYFPTASAAQANVETTFTDSLYALSAPITVAPLPSPRPSRSLARHFWV